MRKNDKGENMLLASVKHMPWEFKYVCSIKTLSAIFIFSAKAYLILLYMGVMFRELYNLQTFPLGAPPW